MVLEGKNLSYRYSQGEWIFQNINFSIKNDEIVGLVGPSGQGKSTLLKILASYLKPKQGTVLLDGEAFSSQERNPVQLIFQHPEKAVNPRLKMQQILDEGWNGDYEILESLGIKNEWLSRYPNELSGGELQRFCVARSLGTSTKILLCDEITTMLDAITQADIWNYLKDYAQANQMGIVMVTHSRLLAAQICTRIVALNKKNMEK